MLDDYDFSQGVRGKYVQPFVPDSTMAMSTSRPYSGPADLHSMLDLLVAVRPAERRGNSPSKVDLRELLALTAVQSTTLWFSRPVSLCDRADS